MDDEPGVPGRPGAQHTHLAWTVDDEPVQESRVDNTSRVERKRNNTRAKALQRTTLCSCQRNVLQLGTRTRTCTVRSAMQLDRSTRLTK